MNKFIRFEIVQRGPQTFYVYGFRQGSDVGESMGHFKTQKSARRHLDKCEQVHLVSAVTVYPGDMHDDMELAHLWITDATLDELRTLRSTIDKRIKEAEHAR